MSEDLRSFENSCFIWERAAEFDLDALEVLRFSHLLMAEFELGRLSNLSRIYLSFDMETF
jgi:hypothetical protein